MVEGWITKIRHMFDKLSVLYREGVGQAIVKYTSQWAGTCDQSVGECLLTDI